MILEWLNQVLTIIIESRLDIGFRSVVAQVLKLELKIHVYFLEVCIVFLSFETIWSRSKDIVSPRFSITCSIYSWVFFLDHLILIAKLQPFGKYLIISSASQFCNNHEETQEIVGLANRRPENPNFWWHKLFSYFFYSKFLNQLISAWICPFQTKIMIAIIIPRKKVHSTKFSATKMPCRKFKDDLDWLSMSINSFLGSLKILKSLKKCFWVEYTWRNVDLDATQKMQLKHFEWIWINLILIILFISYVTSKKWRYVLML